MDLRPKLPFPVKFNMLILASLSFYRVLACNAYRARYCYGIFVCLSVQCRYCVWIKTNSYLWHSSRGIIPVFWAHRRYKITMEPSGALNLRGRENMQILPSRSIRVGSNDLQWASRAGRERSNFSGWSP